MTTTMIQDLLAEAPPRCAGYRMVTQRGSAIPELDFALPVPKEWETIEPIRGMQSWLGGTPIAGFRPADADTLVEVAALRLEHEVTLDDLVPLLVEAAGHEVVDVVTRSREVELAAKDGSSRDVHVRALRNGQYLVFVSGTGSDADAQRDALIAVAGFRPLTPRHELVEPMRERAAGRLHVTVPETWALTAESAVSVRLDPPWEGSPFHLSVGWLEDAPSSEAAITSLVTSLEADGLTYPPARIEPAPPSLSEGTAHMATFEGSLDGHDVRVVIHATRTEAGTSRILLVCPRRDSMPMEWARARLAFRLALASQRLAITEGGPTS